MELKTLIKVEEAKKIILNLINPLNDEVLTLIDSLDRVLAEDIYADKDVPYLNNSSMDGYAIRSRDSAGVSKENIKLFKVIETVRAGHLPSKAVEENQAVKIMTGAPIPEKANSVIKVFRKPKVAILVTGDELIEVDAVVEEDIEKIKGLRYFVRANTRWVDGGYFTKTTGSQSSGVLKSMAGANSLIVLPEEDEFIKKGTRVSVKFFT